MNGVVLLTGATGFLGTQTAREWLEQTELTVIALVRAADAESATRRLARAWWAVPALCAAIGGRVQVCCGDICEPRLGLDEAAYAALVQRVTHIIHTAADIRLDAPLAELRRVNVQGTANLLELARAVQRAHGLVRFAHVSTAYVAGGRVGPVAEADLTEAYGFRSPYEQTKCEAELLVQAARAELPISIFRPGMIVGDARTGAIKAFNTLYFPLRLYLTGRLRVVPARPTLRVNLVPVDYVAAALVRLTLDPRAAGLTFHLVAPASAQPTVRELLDAVRLWARAHLGLRLPTPAYIPLPPFLVGPLQRAQGRLALAGSRSNLAKLGRLLPYFDERREFCCDNVTRLLGPYALDWRAALPCLLEYAVSAGFLHRSDRTVQEQVLYRLQSRSRPVTCYDIVEGHIITHDAATVRQEMLAATNALRCLGITAGERVAIVGLNSTRYLVLDVAIGLLGAVSVPLYYTSPPAELDAILRSSGARCLLIGAPKLLQRLGELSTPLPIVSFCRSPLPAGLARPVMSWEQFLAHPGADQPAHATDAEPAPVAFGDLATLRYTSGTTGQPKGVTFTHGQTRWMAECLASLLPWVARNAPATYLSVLPMNHVVEGLLATYSPYYLPAALDIYFLENLRELPQALPRVRPTIFFSVPRIYERVWEGLGHNPLGRLYLRLANGWSKQLLRPVLRWSVLRKAGWQRCVQLLVGSAPASTDLLRAYHELRIEIHNAYGLTEAPLLTINRLGANRLGTVGQPLPQTELRLAEDGEVLARGPQVTAGYYGPAAGSPLREGWLATGDLGRLTAEGSLVLHGRKKELIKTSYGKYLHPATVEGLLREIPGVTEALLLGEDRPYCTALLWVQADYHDAAAQGIDRAILAANCRLSHPEQVKRWAILAGHLSVEAGELTANLKLKRQAITARFQSVIAALYGIGPWPESVLHWGQAERDGM